MAEETEETSSDLTATDLLELAKLQNPDKATEAGFIWEQDFQREILSLICNDRVFTLETMPLVESKYFQDDAHKRICSIVFAHFKKYKTTPNITQITQELKGQLQNFPDEKRVRILGELATVMEFYNPGVRSRDFYRDQIVYFAKAMAIRYAYGETIKELQKSPNNPDTYIKIGKMIKEALLIDRDFEMGLDYFQTAPERYERKKQIQESGDIFTTGFKSIDSSFKNNGLLRGEAAAWMGLSGTGKSLALVAAAIANLKRKKRVLYITLEINQDAVADRFDAQMADPGRVHGITTSNLYEKKEIVFKALDDYVEDYKNSSLDGKMMIVKQFAGATLDVPSLRAYFSQLKMHGFSPDLVIIDYIGEMKDYPGVKTHESRYMIVRDLRGFAVEENICVLSAMQPNKSGKEAVRTGMLMDEENLGDSFSQIKPLDAFWTINQLQDEKECGLARVYVAKTRDGKSRFSFYIQFNYDNLSMREISQSMYDAIYKKHKSEKEETIMDRNAKELEQKKLYDRPKRNSNPNAKPADKDKKEPILGDKGKKFASDPGFSGDSDPEEIATDASLAEMGGFDLAEPPPTNT
jgi:replicative DNA helicase